MAPNTTREQALERGGLLEVHSYRIELDLTDGHGEPGSGTFRSTTTVLFGARVPGASTWIDLVADTVHRALLNGVELDVSDYREDHGIALPDLDERNELVVEADCRYTNTGRGLHRFVDPADDEVYLYTQFETADAKRVFACFDQPDLKSTYDLVVVAPDRWEVVSNSAAQVVERGAGEAVHRFATTKPVSTYLVALVAGPYRRWTDDYVDEHGTIPLGICCRASLAEHMDHERLFTETKQGFAFFHRAFGVPYPFGKYDQCFVPEFNLSAMENAGCVTFRDDFVFRSRVTADLYERRCKILLHEMAHMWFGDLVTMKWWDDLWLNESFATWAAVLAQAEATGYPDAWTTFANWEKSWAYHQDQLPSTHPIRADIPDLRSVEVNFDGITYAKGAAVLKQLVAYVGLDDFLTGLRLYFVKHAWGNAVLTDLLNALEEASGRDLSWWSAQWLETTGLNLLRTEHVIGDDGKITDFAVRQRGAAPGSGELRAHRIAVGAYDLVEEGRLVRTHRVEVDVVGARTEVPDLVGVPRGKLVLLNDDDLTYCAVRLDPESVEALVRHTPDIEDPLARSLCWSTAWEMVRDAELCARDFIDMALRGLGVETQIGAVQRLLHRTRTALSSYAHPSWRDEGWRLFRAEVLALARGAERGSDHQLAFVDALSAAVLDDRTAAELGGWLAGVDVPPGLDVDTDLRWRLLHALVAHGAADLAEIEAEAERDCTAAGHRRAETARALRPTREAKDKAWRRAVHDDELPNAISAAILAGIPHPGHTALLEPYAERYFAEVAGVWDRRSNQVAHLIAVRLFPAWSVGHSTVAAADEWLAGEHPPALRRLVGEGRADMVRALAAQDFDLDGAR